MAKKSRKPQGGKRPESDKPDGEEVVADADADAEPEADEPAPVATPSRPAGAGVSPLLRSQEVELEIGLSLLGAVVGALTGFGTGIPIDAPSGNVVGAIEAALIGAMMGYSLGRTLFLSVRTQWIAWVVLVALAAAGVKFLGLVGGLAGAAIGTGLVVMGYLGGDDGGAALEGATTS